MELHARHPRRWDCPTPEVRRRWRVMIRACCAVAMTNGARSVRPAHPARRVQPSFVPPGAPETELWRRLGRHYQRSVVKSEKALPISKPQAAFRSGPSWCRSISRAANTRLRLSTRIRLRALPFEVDYWGSTKSAKTPAESTGARKRLLVANSLPRAQLNPSSCSWSSADVSSSAWDAGTTRFDFRADAREIVVDVNPNQDGAGTELSIMAGSQASPTRSCLVRSWLLPSSGSRLSRRRPFGLHRRSTGASRGDARPPHREISRQAFRSPECCLRPPAARAAVADKPSRSTTSARASLCRCLRIKWILHAHCALPIVDRGQSDVPRNVARRRVIVQPRLAIVGMQIAFQPTPSFLHGLGKPIMTVLDEKAVITYSTDRLAEIEEYAGAIRTGRLVPAPARERACWQTPRDCLGGPRAIDDLALRSDRLSVRRHRVPGLPRRRGTDAKSSSSLAPGLNAGDGGIQRSKSPAVRCRSARTLLPT